MGTLELTFAILKPHLVKNPIFFKSVRNIILTSNFDIIQSKRHNVTKKEAEFFYKEHKEKFFYNRLVSFMIRQLQYLVLKFVFAILFFSGPSQLYILAREDGIKMWRQLMGPTKVFKTIFEAPDTIRGQFGLSDTRNAAHGSGLICRCTAKTVCSLHYLHLNIPKGKFIKKIFFTIKLTNFSFGETY